jgi:hypothetical protein
MKTEGWLFTGVAIFVAPVAVLYWWLSKEPAGTTALALTFGLAAMVGYYLLFTARRIDQRPEDDRDAEIADGAGELGFYSPHSWWPLALTGSLALATLGMIFGWWMVYFTVPLVLLAVVGFVFEYYRGANQRH